MEPEEKEAAEAAESKPLGRKQTHAHGSGVGLIYASNMRGFLAKCAFTMGMLLNTSVESLCL